MKNQVKLTDVRPNLAGKYVIVASTPECVSNRYHQGDIIRRSCNMRVLEWIADDDYHYGYELAAAKNIIDSYYMSDEELHYEDDDSARELMAAICDDEDVEYDGELPEWYKGAGYYVDDVLICKAGETMMYDARDIRYWVEAADEIMIEMPCDIDE